MATQAQDDAQSSIQPQGRLVGEDDEWLPPDDPRSVAVRMSDGAPPR